MCGICGIFNYSSKLPIEKKLLNKMCNAIIHRGPDDEGYYFSPDSAVHGSQIGLGIRRLSIIDLQTGHQPIHNEDAKIWVIDNGEIYNFQELRLNLQEKGHKFYTKTDTEVIVHLYEDYGIDCVKYLRGMFAFALWDEKKRKLFLVRDRLGKKPLSYTIHNGYLIFGSEIKCILEISEIKREINLEALHYYLTYQYVPSPLSMFKNIKKLPPASILSCDEQGNINIQNYWNLNYRNKLNLREEEYGEQIREKLKEATKLRMISDVPLGAFLSGGIDSSAIVGLMSEISSEPVKTFSIGFEEQDFSELEYARLVANHFGTNHQEFIVKPQMIDILPKLVWHYGEPYADSSALPSYYVARETRKYVTVALNGDGGDENFAGYMRYKANKIAYFVAKIYRYAGGKRINFILDLFAESSNQQNFLRKAKRFSSALFESPEYRNIQWHCFFNNEQKMRLYSDEMRDRFAKVNAYDYMAEIFINAPADDFLDKILYTDVRTYLPEDLLVKMDIAAMANSLEVRSPFLDHKFMEFAVQIPAYFKLRGLTLKYILKKSMKGFLPKKILNRSKMGFGIPIAKWFRQDLKEYIKEILLDKKSTKRGYFNHKYVEQMIEEHISGRRDHGYRLWALLMFELWHRIYIDGEKL